MSSPVKRNLPIAVLLLFGLGFVMAVNGLSPFVYIIWPIVMAGQFVTWFFAGKETVYRENRESLKAYR
jgi:hypothetical protein